MTGGVPDRSRPGRWRSIGLVLAGLALVWLAALSLTLDGEGDATGSARPRDEYAWAFDYEAYVAAARRITITGSPYTDRITSAPFESGPGGLYYYSPVLAVALLPVAGTPASDSSSWWFVLHVLALLGACALMPVRPSVRLFAFVVSAFSLTVMRDMTLGNISTLLLLPTVMTWRWLDRPLGSIALAVGVAVRPSLGLILVWQGLRRQWRALTWTIGAGIVLILITLPFVGIDGYLDYLAVLRNLNVPSTLSDDWHNHDLGALAMSAGASTELVGLVRLASIVAGLSAMLLSLRRDHEVSFMVTLMATLIVVPILWDHYLAMLIIPAAFLAQRWRPVALLLPLLSWLPVLSVFAVLLAMLLPFLAPSRGAASGAAIGPDTQGTVAPAA